MNLNYNPWKIKFSSSSSSSPSLSLFVRLSPCPPVCLPLSVSLYVSVSLYLFLYPCVCLCLSVSLRTLALHYLSFTLSVIVNAMHAVTVFLSLLLIWIQRTQKQRTKSDFHENAKHWKKIVVGPENILFTGASVHLSARIFYRLWQWKG